MHSSGAASSLFWLKCDGAAGEAEPISLDEKGSPVLALQSLVVEERNEDGDLIIRHNVVREAPADADASADASISGADRLVGGGAIDKDTARAGGENTSCLGR